MIERTANIVSEDGIVKMTSKGWGGIIYRIRKDKITATVLDSDHLDKCAGIYILISKNKTIRVGKGDIHSRISAHKSSSDNRKNFFDYVYSDQVLHHTKNTKTSFQYLTKFLKKSGFISTAYNCR